MSFLHSGFIIINNDYGAVLKRSPIKNHNIEYVDYSEILDFRSIRRLLLFISGLRKKLGNVKLPFVISYPCVNAIDKLTIQLLECIVYSLIVDYGYRVIIDIKLKKQIHTEGFAFSPLQHLQYRKHNVDEFVKSFESGTALNYYRKVIPIEWSTNGNLGSIIFSDIICTLKNCDLDEEYAESLAEVITELVNNANEHNCSDCLIDMDISDDYSKRDDPEGVFIGVNVSVLSFSQCLIPDLLKKKIVDSNELDGRYKKVLEAYNNHRSFFDDEYDDSDFFKIASFQDRISGRPSTSSSGGTGLTKLIKSLEDHSDGSSCYVVSGKRALYFLPEYLDMNADGWVGFNESNDFINTPPNKDVFQTSPIFIPGVAYNLNFIYKKG